MRTKLIAASALLTLVALASRGDGQAPSDVPKSVKGKSGDTAIDFDKEILKQIREAYKATYEVPEDVLKELRRSYQKPSAEREADILRDLRRLYVLTPERETAILRELRLAYERQSPEQEERFFREIEKAQRLPEGAVPAHIQSAQAEKLFRKLDLNDDNRLSPDETPDQVRSDRARWDKNRDGYLDPGEYSALYQARLRWLGDEVSAGRIDLALKRGGPAPMSMPPDDDARPKVFRAGKLPSGLPPWFEEYDLDRDGQVSLFEWRVAGMPLKGFGGIDRNDDGLVTPEEALRHVALSPQEPASATPFEGKKSKKK